MEEITYLVSIMLKHQKIKPQRFNYILKLHATTQNNTKIDHIRDSNHSLWYFGIFWCKLKVRRDL